MEYEAGTAGALYAQLETFRQPFLDRARRAVRLTIPSLLRQTVQGTGADKFPTPFQSLGARGVNNLSSKLLLTLLPPNTPFFKLTIGDIDLERLTGDDKARAEVEASLLKIEQAVMNDVETTAMRVVLFEGLKHLVACGNAMIYLLKEGGIRVYHLDQYVVDRDASGTVCTIITKECSSVNALDTEVRKFVLEECYKNVQEEYSKIKNIDIFTRVELEDDGKYHVVQEIMGKQVPKTDGTYTKDDLPFIPLRMSHISNESYGRGFVEEYEGDLISLEGLSQSIVEASAAASRLLCLVNPNGSTRLKDVSDAANGAVKPGNAEDVTFLHMEKNADLQVAQATAQVIRGELAASFLLNSSVTRQAERVTAEEIRYVAQELEDALGGVYSILGVELQRPLVTRMLSKMKAADKIPKLPAEVKFQIVTGFEALGRGHELSKLDVLIAGTAQDLGPETVAEYVNAGDLFTRRANALNLNIKGLVRSEEEVQALRAEKQKQAMIEKLGPPTIQAIGRNSGGESPTPPTK